MTSGISNNLTPNNRPKTVEEIIDTNYEQALVGLTKSGVNLPIARLFNMAIQYNGKNEDLNNKLKELCFLDPVGSRTALQYTLGKLDPNLRKLAPDGSWPELRHHLKRSKISGKSHGCIRKWDRQIEERVNILQKQYPEHHQNVNKTKSSLTNEQKLTISIRQEIDSKEDLKEDIDIGVDFDLEEKSVSNDQVEMDAPLRVQDPNTREMYDLNVEISTCLRQATYGETTVDHYFKFLKYINRHENIKEPAYLFWEELSQSDSALCSKILTNYYFDNNRFEWKHNLSIFLDEMDKVSMNISYSPSIIQTDVKNLSIASLIKLSLSDNFWDRALARNQLAAIYFIDPQSVLTKLTETLTPLLLEWDIPVPDQPLDLEELGDIVWGTCPEFKIPFGFLLVSLNLAEREIKRTEQDG